jgi:hypothetical protein
MEWNMFIGRKNNYQSKKSIFLKKYTVARDMSINFVNLEKILRKIF